MTERSGLGWIPDVPDWRDYGIASLSAKRLLRAVGATAEVLGLPAAVDLRPTFSPIENQLSIGSCCVQAYAGLVEYFWRMVNGKHVNVSRLFGYWVVRKLMGLTGDSGASLRDTMKAAALFGLPPEQYWPYRVADYDREPTGFVYSLAKEFQATEYYRLDSNGVFGEALLERIKANLAARLPSMFGIPWYSCADQAETNGGGVPYPAPGDRLLGGHAIVAAGYNDSFTVRNAIDKSETTGALLIRNSWGTGWANKGYGWLPYKYVVEGLAVDWWSLTKAEWVDLGVFN